MIYATNGDREPKVPVRDLMQKNLAVNPADLTHVSRVSCRPEALVQIRTVEPSIC
jgi:hypothetical protein